MYRWTAPGLWPSSWMSSRASTGRRADDGRICEPRRSPPPVGDTPTSSRGLTATGRTHAASLMGPRLYGVRGRGMLLANTLPPARPEALPMPHPRPRTALLPTLVVLTLAAVAPVPAAACSPWEDVLPLVGACDTDAVNVQRVVMAGAWALALDHSGYSARTLRVYDLHDPEAPALAASLPLPWRTAALQHVDGRLYAAGLDTLAVYDVSVPAQPVLLGRAAIAGDHRDLEVQDGLCALAAGEDGLVLVEVADPAFLTVRSTLGFAYWDAVSLDLRGDRLLLGLKRPNDGALHWVDVADPAAPVVLNSLPMERSLDQVRLLDGTDRALVACGIRLYALALSDDAPPQILSERLGAGERLVLWDDLALSMYWHVGDAMLLDLAEPLDVRWLAPFARLAFDAVRKSDHLVLARGPEGLGVVPLPGADLLDGGMPVAGVLDDGDWIGVGALAATDDPHLVLELGRDAIRLLDVADPAAPVARGQLALPDAHAATLDGDRTLILAEGDAWLVDLADPDAPVSLGHPDLPPGAIRALWQDQRYYVCAGSDGLVIMDAGDPLQPVELGRLDTSGSVRNVAVDGSLAVIADNAGGLRTADVSNPAAPQLLGQLTGVHGNLLQLVGARAFIGGWLAPEVAEVDLADPAAPALAATVALPDDPNALLVHAGRLWVASGPGLDVLDVTTPGAPRPLGQLRGRTGAVGLAPAADGVVTDMWQIATIRPPCSTPTAVVDPVDDGSDDPAADPAGSAEARSTLTAAPNPGNPSIQLQFTLPRRSQVRLDMFDLAGRLVRRLHHGPLARGAHTITWDGRYAGGEAAPSGVYVARLAPAGGPAPVTTRVTLVR